MIMSCREENICVDMKDDKAGFSYGKSFSIIYRHGKIIHERMLRQLNISGPQIWYLKEIHENPGISQEDISQDYHIDKGSVSRAVKKLSESGLVKIESNPEDKRAYRLFLTEKAENIYGCCTKQMRFMKRHIEKGMSGEEIETFRRLLAKVTENMAELMEEGKDI